MATNRTRRPRPAPGSRVPTPIFSRINGICVDGMHLWCPGTDGRSGHECLCRCHTGHHGEGTAA